MILSLILSVVAFAGFPDYDPSWGLKKEVYTQAIEAYSKYKFTSRYALVADFSQHSSKRRFYLFDLTTETVERNNVAHGSGSDKNNDGFATEFSNISGSHMSSLGAYRTAETYSGKHGLSMKLDGLEKTNSKARARAIVLHSASYVKNGIRAGRSQGCPAVDVAVYKSIINRTKGGSLLYIGR